MPARIYRMNIDGSAQTNLSNSQSSAVALDSDSQNRILFQESGEIYLMDIDGGNRLRLTENDVTDSHPSFSSTANMISYRSDGNIWLMSSDGSNKIQLTSGIDVSGIPAISQDESRIVFWGSNEISIINIDGTGLKILDDGKFPQFIPR